MSTTNASVFQAISFSPGVPLTAGQQYVLLATTLKDTNTSQSGVWGALRTDAYAGGQFVFNNAADFASLLTTSWDSSASPDTPDLAFSARSLRPMRGRPGRPTV